MAAFKDEDFNLFEAFQVFFDLLSDGSDVYFSEVHHVEGLALVLQSLLNLFEGAHLLYILQKQIILWLLTALPKLNQKDFFSHPSTLPCPSSTTHFLILTPLSPFITIFLKVLSPGFPESLSTKTQYRESATSILDSS